jgi:hypothetical protein
MIPPCGRASGGARPAGSQAHLKEQERPVANIKGNAVVFTQGGPTAVINASWVGVVEGLKKAREVTGVWGAMHGIDGILKEDFVDLRAQSAATLKAIARTPATQLLSTRHKPTADDNQKMLAVFRKHNIRYVFGAGGNDTSESLDIINDAAKAMDYELRLFHVAKTVDNDLMENDHTPGYASAARYVANAFRGADLDNQCFGGFYVAVCMGRHAGFLTAASALGRTTPESGPHLVYLPEKVFDLERSRPASSKPTATATSSSPAPGPWPTRWSRRSSRTSRPREWSRSSAPAATPWATSNAPSRTRARSTARRRWAWASSPRPARSPGTSTARWPSSACPTSPTGWSTSSFP